MCKTERLSSVLLLVLCLAIGACMPAETPLLVGGEGAADSAPTTAPRLSVCMSNSPVNVVPAYAQARGLFQKHGLEVELLDTGGGSDTITALVAGDFDLCQAAGSAAVNAVVGGHDLVLVAGIVNQQLYSLVVRPEIAGSQDLVGKAVAVAGPGGASDRVMRTALQALGLQPDKDVAVLSVGGQGERLAAMETGQVVGTVISVPEVSKAIQLGYHVLLDPSDLDTPYQHTTIVVPREFLDSHRGEVTAFVKALVEAITMMKQDREGTMAVLADILKMDTVADADFLAEAYDVLVQKYVADTPYPSRDGVQALLDEAASENPAALSMDPDTLIDASIVKELEDTGFIQARGSQ